MSETTRNQAASAKSGGGHGWLTVERKRALGLFAFFFLVIAAFWVQKPIRTSRFLTAVGPEYVPWVKLGTAMLILPLVLLYSAVAAHVRRERMVYLCVTIFMTASATFWLLFSTVAPIWSHYAYFFYVDVFNSVMVALFWSFANDLTTTEDAKRTYGFVGAGGILGGAAGSSLTGVTVEHLGTANLLLVCIAILFCIALVARFVAGLSASATDTAAPADRQPSLRDAVAGARLTWASRYLMYIALLVALYEIVSNLIDYQFNVAIAARYNEEAQMAAFLGQFNSVAIVASLLVQLVVTSAILRWWGPRVGLMVLPLSLALGSAAFLATPVFAVAAALFFSDALLSYSLNQSTKELLYTPTDEAAKYQAKAFIDMFLMRLAKGASALLVLAWIAWMAPRGWQIHELALVSLVVIALWLLVARAAARRFEEIVRSGKGSQPRAGVASDPALITATRARMVTA